MLAGPLYTVLAAANLLECMALQQASLTGPQAANARLWGHAKRMPASVYRGVCSAPGWLGDWLLVEHNVSSVSNKLVLRQAALQGLNQVEGQGTLALHRLPA